MIHEKILFSQQLVRTYYLTETDSIIQTVSIGYIVKLLRALALYNIVVKERSKLLTILSKSAVYRYS